MTYFDLESTSPDPQTARVIQLAFLDEQGAPLLVSLVNPGCPILADSTAVHGLTDADVAGAPAFRELADRVARLCDGAELVGQGVLHFDVPLLARELEMAGMEFTPRLVIDSGNLFKIDCPRTLAAAVGHYLGEEPTGLHRADADAEYSRRVFLAQRERMVQLKGLTPEQVAELSNYGRRLADPAGHLAYVGGRLCIAHRKLREEHKRPDGSLPDGVPVADAVGYAHWMLSRSFPAGTVRLLEAELARLDAEAREPEAVAAGNPGQLEIPF